MIYLDSNEAIRFISQFCDTSHLSFLVVQHIQRMYQLLLGFSLKYTPRSMNQVADFFLAKRALSSSPSDLVFNGPPKFLYGLL